MNNMINKFLLTGNKFIPEWHLKQPGLTYSAGGLFTKHRERTQKSRETGNLKHLYRNELDEAFCSHNSVYSDSKGLAKRTISNKILKDRAYEIGRNRKYYGYQRALPSMVYKVSDKKTGSGISINEQQADELHKPVQNSKEEKSMGDLKTIFGQLIELR